MDVEKQILSDITIYTKYARFLPEQKRRESWEEIVERNMKMHLKHFPQLQKEIVDCYADFVLPKKVLPSMRSMQFAGKPIETNPIRVYNCSYLPVDSLYAFSELLFLLLAGAGVGFSVQRHHVEQLPEIRKPTNGKRRYLISDNIEGWSDSIRVLMKSYFGIQNSFPVFDFNN